MIDTSYEELNQYKGRQKQLTKVRKNIEVILSENTLEKRKDKDTSRAKESQDSVTKGYKKKEFE